LYLDHLKTGFIQIEELQQVQGLPLALLDRSRRTILLLLKKAWQAGLNLIQQLE
jgi:hypothetical protein